MSPMLPQPTLHSIFHVSTIHPTWRECSFSKDPASRTDAKKINKLLPEWADLLDQRQVADADVDLVGNAIVFRIHG